MVRNVRGEYIEKFIGKNVALGVPHWSRDDPYFFFGQILNVTDDYVEMELQNGSGYKQIKLVEIIDVHLDPKRQNGNKTTREG